MLESYVPILMMIVGAIGFAIVNVLASRIFGPRKPNTEKLSTYESGVEPIGSAHSKYSVKYYMVAVMFIIFDIEVVFMYPWAVTFKSFTGGALTYMLLEMIVFIVLLLIGYFYILRKGTLKWN